MLLFIENFDSFSYNIIGAIEKFYKNIKIFEKNKITLEKAIEIKPSFLVIGPGPGNPKDTIISIQLVKHFYNKIPILGICLGHQVIGEVFGSKIIKSKNPMHGKTSKIIHQNRNLFKNVKMNPKIVRYNSLTIDKQILSKDFEIDAEDYNGEIMAISHKLYPIYGIQFHPESILTEDGDEIFKNFIKKESNLN